MRGLQQRRCRLPNAMRLLHIGGYFGKVNFLHLFGKKSYIVYGVIAVVFVFLGSVFYDALVWDLTDMFNNLMVIPNAIALFALSAMVVSATKFGKKDDLGLDK